MLVWAASVDASCFALVIVLSHCLFAGTLAAGLLELLLGFFLLWLVAWLLASAGELCCLFARWLGWLAALLAGLLVSRLAA